MPPNPCYACDQPFTSMEDVPPRGLLLEDKDLPDGLDLQRGRMIRVPSCDEHNKRKSDDDEYFRYVLACNVTANSLGLHQALTKVRRSFRYRPEMERRFLGGARPVRIGDSHSDLVVDGYEIPLERDRFFQSLRLVALGAYRDHKGVSFGGSVSLFADFIDYPEDVEYQTIRRAMFDEATRLFAAAPRHGENQEVFWYQVSEQIPHAIMRLGFCGSATATAVFGEIAR